MRNRLLLFTLLLLAQPSLAERTWFMERAQVLKEFLLEQAPSAKVLDQVRGRYPDVLFEVHPTMNGFYAVAGEREMAALTREVARLDVVPAPPAPTIRPFLTVSDSDYESLNCTLIQITPDGLKTLGVTPLEGWAQVVETRREFVNGLEVEAATTDGPERTLQVLAP